MTVADRIAFGVVVVAWFATALSWRRWRRRVVAQLDEIREHLDR